MSHGTPTDTGLVDLEAHIGALRQLHEPMRPRISGNNPLFPDADVWEGEYCGTCHVHWPCHVAWLVVTVPQVLVDLRAARAELARVTALREAAEQYRNAYDVWFTNLDKSGSRGIEGERSAERAHELDRAIQALKTAAFTVGGSNVR